MKHSTRIFASAVVLLTAMAGAAGAQQKAAAPAKAEPTEAHLKAKATISEGAATKTALAAVPGGKVEGHELEEEGGKLIYSFDIKVAGKPGIEEIQVDAVSGKVVAHEHEDDEDEAKEAKEEAAKKAPTRKP